MMTQKNTSEINIILTWLGRFSAITGAIGVFLYVIGFIASTAHFRILGLTPSHIPTQEYLETGGRCAGLIFQALMPGPQNLVLNLFTPAYTIPGMNWGGSWLVCWWAALVFLIIWMLAHWRFYPVFPVVRRESFKNAFKITAIMGAVALAGTMISLESEILKIPSRLQPFGASDFVPVSSAIPLSKNTASDYAAILTHTQQTTGYLLKIAKEKPSPSFVHLFSPEDETGYDLPRLMTFCKIVWLTALTLFILFRLFCINQDRTARIIKAIFMIFLTAQVIFLPAVYGIMGREYNYPVIRAECKYNQDIITHFPVILLVSNDKEIIIYDRINRMSIRHIPKSAVLNIEQYFLTSPFSNCSGDANPERIIPCELEAIAH